MTEERTIGYVEMCGTEKPEMIKYFNMDPN